MSGGTPLGNMVIKLGLDDAEFGKGVENSKKQVRYLAKEMQANMKIADMAGNQLGKLGTRYDGLTKIIGAQEKQVQALKKAYDESFVDGKATDSTKRLAAQLQDANGKLANYKQQLINTAGAMAEYKVRNEGFTGAINKASNSLIKNGQTMENYGGKLTKGITLPLVSGAAAVTTAAISWESAFAGVKKTVDEVVDSNGRVTYSYKDLENGLRGLSKELPSSHKEIAAVAEAAGQLGIETPNVVSFTKTMIDLGESTSMSAETAATELARFANITGMSQDKFSNLGSALVDLGNNFATTEGEISAMSLRLAGAGSQIGMTEGEILGFAAALSSVGVEAEAGGSAFSKVMIQMQLATEKGMVAFDELINLGNQSGVSFDQMSYAVQKGGNTLKATAGQMGLTNKQLSSMYKEADKSAVSLQNFAEVAGMTNAEFGNMFKQDPSKAIMKFVEGLANAESQGKSAIAVLDDMDITEVRLRDSLLRAANASGVFSDAVTMGNKAFKENTALAEEAGKRYETTESKLKMLKNEAVDAAIDLGGPFVDALRSGLESSKPLIKGLGDLAKKFSELEPKTQRNIVKFIGMAAAAGPLLSITGKLSTGIGGLGKAFVDLSAKSAKKKAIAEITTELAKGTVEIGAYSTALGGGSKSLGTFGGAATKASGATGLGGFITTLGSVNPYVLGTVAVLGAGAAAWVAYDRTVGESNRRAAQWGSDIGKAASDSLGEYKKLSDEGQQAIRDLDSGTSSSAKNISETFTGMADDIAESGEKVNKKIQEAINKLPQEMQKSVQESANKQIEANKQSVKIADDASKQIIGIYEKHKGDISKFSEDEKQLVINNQRTLNAEKVRLMELSASEEKTVLAALNGDIRDMTNKQRETAIGDLQKFHTEKQKSFLENKENLKIALGEGTEEYKTELTKLETINKASTDQIAINTVKLAQANGESFEQIKVRLNALGINYKDHARIVEEANKSASKSNSLLAKSTDEMNEKSRDANLAWNSLIWDEQKAEVKSNAQEEVTKSIQSAEGWNQMQLILKHANLDSDAKEVIFNSIQETGKWNGLDIDPKLLKADNVQLIQALVESKTGLTSYNELSPELKTLLADGPAKMTIDDTKKALDDYIEIGNPELKTLLAENSDAVSKFNLAQVKLDTFNITNPAHKLLTGDNSNVSSAANQGVNSLNIFNANNPAQKQLQGNASSTISATTAGGLALNAFARNNPASKNLNANDNASGPAYSARDAVSSFSSGPSVITKTLNVVANIGKGVASILGLEKGTNYHVGGPAIVNDQKGSNYKELVIPQGGVPFIPEGRDVFLPNLKRGSKVIKASDTKRIMNRMGVPRYAQGVGVPKNSTLIKDLESVSNKQDNSIKDTSIVIPDNSGQLDTLISVVSQFGEDLKNMQVILDGRNIAKYIEVAQSNKNKIDMILKGGRPT